MQASQVPMLLRQKILKKFNMWYRTSQNKARGLEEKILEGDAEHAIRRRLYFTGDYNPDQEKITRLTNRAMKKILDKYGNYNVVRHHLSGELLSPIVDEIVDSLVKLGH